MYQGEKNLDVIAYILEIFETLHFQVDFSDVKKLYKDKMNTFFCICCALLLQLRTEKRIKDCVLPIGEGFWMMKKK